MVDFNIDSILEDSEPQQQQFIEVTAPSGANVSVMNAGEAKYYNQISQRYQSDNLFKNVSDILELDRILLMELMCHRWSSWILMESDYDGRNVNPTEIQKYIESYSKEIRGIKRDLGMDKSSRDKDNESSVADYIHNLSLRAREFGIVRNKQAIKAITLLKELQGIVTLFDNSTDDERREFHCREADILQWVRDSIPAFDEIDAALRQEQKMWIRTI